MLKRLADGQELGELVITARNTYTNLGSVAQFDFHKSDNSNVSVPLLSFLSSSDLMESTRAWLFHDFGFHHLNLTTNLRVIVQLEYLQPIDVRHRDLVSQDMQRVENTHCLHSRQLSPFLYFDCLRGFPVIDSRNNNGYLGKAKF